MVACYWRSSHCILDQMFVCWRRLTTRQPVLVSSWCWASRIIKDCWIP